MHGEHDAEGRGRCAICGGRLQPAIATIPFVFGEDVVIVKHVPADVCGQCHEPYMASQVTDHVVRLLRRLRQTPAEVSIAAYSEAEAPLSVAND